MAWVSSDMFTVQSKEITEGGFWGIGRGIGALWELLSMVTCSLVYNSRSARFGRLARKSLEAFLRITCAPDTSVAFLTDS